MPVLKDRKAGTVLAIKRGLSPGFAVIDNSLCLLAGIGQRNNVMISSRSVRIIVAVLIQLLASRAGGFAGPSRNEQDCSLRLEHAEKLLERVITTSSIDDRIQLLQEAATNYSECLAIDPGSFLATVGFATAHRSIGNTFRRLHRDKNMVREEYRQAAEAYERLLTSDSLTEKERAFAEDQAATLHIAAGDIARMAKK